MFDRGRAWSANGRLCLVVLAAFAVLLCASVPTSQAGVPTVVLDSRHQEQFLLPLAETLVDQGNRLTARDMARPDVAKRFTPNRKAGNDFGFTDATTWFRFTVANNTRDERHAVLITGRVHPENFTLYYQDGDVVVPIYFQTNRVPWRKMALQLPLSVPGTQRTFLARLRGTGLPVILALRLSTREAFEDFAFKETLCIGVYLGLMGLVCLVAVAMFVALRNFALLTFSLFVLGFTGFQAVDMGVIQMVLPPGPWHELGVWISLFTIQLFSWNFLELKRFPRISKALLIMMAICATFMLLSPWKAEFGPLENRIKIIPMMFLGTSGILIWSAWMRLRQGFRPARLYLLSWLPLFGGIMTHLAYIESVAPPSGIFEFGGQIGAVLQVLFAWFALAEMIKMQREQAQLKILQMEHETATRLEQEVRERTRDLHESHLRLENQNQELEQQTQLLGVEKQKAEKAMESAKQASLAKGEFLANMSHEIRTPMNAIIGLTHLALQTSLTPQQKDYLCKIDRSSASLLRLIDDILDFSKVEAGRLDLDNQPFSLQEDVLESLRSVIGFRCAEKNLAFLLEVDEAVPPLLSGDPLRLEQVLLNLASNAVKFTDQGEVSIFIGLDAEAEANVTLRCTVRDTGIGMSREQIDQLFQPFQQADTSITRTYGGTGLGLVISKRLVQMMDGDITLTSEPGKGSTFTFTARFGMVEGEALPCLQRFPTEQIRVLLDGCVLLLAEDNEVNLQVARELLEQVGAKVVSARNGREAVELALRDPFDAILMDMQMPVMDGLKATRELRQHFPPDVLPILAMTANAMVSDRRRCRAAGMNDHIPKPIRPHTLYCTLLRWLRPEASTAVVAGSKAEGVTTETEAPFPPINSLDTRRGLSNMNNDRQLYMNVLRRTHQEHAGIADAVRDAFARGDHAEALRLTHSFKGVAGTIGALEVNAAAAELEAVLASGHGEAAEAKVQALRETVVALMGALGEFLAGERAASPADADAASPEERLDTAQFRARLHALGELIKEGDAASLELAQQLKSALAAHRMAPLVQELEARLADYDFDEARQTLDKIFAELDSGGAVQH